jgi:predicted small metal-binding protein
MYTLADKDLGIECDEVSEGASVEEAVRKAKDHALAEHSDTVAEMMKTMTEEQMLEKMTRAVRSA